MSVNVANLIMGPATVYIGAFGAAEPLDSQVNTTPAASAWTDVGGTMGGVKLTINQTYTILQVDQVVDTVGRRLTNRDIMLAVPMAEVTLANIQSAMNGGTVGASAGVVAGTYDPSNAISATQPLYSSTIFDGWSPGQFRRRIIVRKVLSVNSFDIDYAEATQTVMAVVFGCHYVSAAIPLFHVVDANV